MTFVELTVPIVYIGMFLLGIASFPQLKNPTRTSKVTYTLILLGQMCYLFRYIAIKELALSVSGIAGLIVTWLVWRKLK